MLRVELIPLNKGNLIVLDDTTVITIGRTAKIGCSDNRVSRNHAQLFLRTDGTVWIKSIHYNPTFYKTKKNQIVSLTKDKEYQLYDNDQFGLLPDEYLYRVSIKSNDDVERDNHGNLNPTINSSAIPKSPVDDKEVLTLENHDEEKAKSNVNQTRILPAWMSDSSVSTTTNEKEISYVNTPTTSLVKKRTDTGERKSKEIVYDDDDNKPTTTTSATRKTVTTDHTDPVASHSRSSSTVDSTKRERCPYGVTCYRKNLIHRQQAIHRGDSDWDPDEDDQGNAKPVCPFGNKCYRTNTNHLNEYLHPSKRRTVEYKDDDSPNGDDDEENLLYDEDIVSTDRSIDDEEANDDIEWKPHKDSRYADETDGDSTDDSDKELVKKEAADFIKGSTVDRHGSVIKKPRVDDD